jgi:single-strand DNA-binding protein
MQNNTPVCNFTLAVDRRFSKDKQADFISCQAWQKTAEFITKYFGKGNLLAIVGRIQTRTWDDEDGKRHYVTEVVAEEAYFTGERNNSRPEPQDDRFELLDDDELPFQTKLYRRFDNGDD